LAINDLVRGGAPQSSPQQKPKQEVIALDIDKTLTELEDGDIERYGHEYFGVPIPEMVERVKQAMAEGAEVWFFTARVTPFDESYQQWVEATESYVFITQLSLKLFGKILPVTNIKLRRFTQFWDDRGRQVIENTGVFADDLMEAAQQ